MNQCWNIVNCTLANKFQWNLNPNLSIFIEENAFENVVWKSGGHLVSASMCVKYPCLYSRVQWSDFIGCLRLYMRFQVPTDVTLIYFILFLIMTLSFRFGPNYLLAYCQFLYYDFYAYLTQCRFLFPDTPGVLHYDDIPVTWSMTS